MVDPFQLTSDIASNAISLALPAFVWATFFLLAWDAGPFAESLGLGRRAFWLLLPGSLLATFAILPFAPVSYDLVGISYSGALFPLMVGLLALGRVAPPLRASGGRYLAFVAIESAVFLMLVLPSLASTMNAIGGPLGPGLAPTVLILPIAVVVSLVAIEIGRRAVDPTPPDGSSPRTAPLPAARAVAFLVPLTSGVLVATFASSAAIPGVGIVEQFPAYLLPPIGAGALAVLLAPQVFPGREGVALPLAFLATTFGVLLGADLLRQPPLYGSGPAGIYAIGGAGVLDLVYLSGLLALGSAYVFYRVLRRPVTPIAGEVVPREPTPYGYLARAFRAGVDGRLNEALSESSAAGHAAADQARRLLDLPPAPVDRPWQGLPVPGWVVSDQSNLDASARAGTSDGREGFRAWLTARGLVVLGQDLGRPRFGAIGTRSFGFFLDLVTLSVPAVAVWAAVVLVTPGGIDGILSSLAFSAAIYGFIALSFLYLAVSEAVTGTSIGKRALGLVVRDRRLQPVDFLSSLVRNIFVLPILTVLGLGGSLAVLFALKFGSFASVTVGGIALPGGVVALGVVLAFLVGGIGLLGAFGALLIALTSERQRLGDLLAGTWVVRTIKPKAASPAPPVPSPSPSGPGPSG